MTYAEKSAAAVAAMAASADSRDCQTAPLWPRKVPILDLTFSQHDAQVRVYIR